MSEERTDGKTFEMKVMGDVLPAGLSQVPALPRTKSSVVGKQALLNAEESHRGVLQLIENNEFPSAAALLSLCV